MNNQQSLIEVYHPSSQKLLAYARLISGHWFIYDADTKERVLIAESYEDAEHLMHDVYIGSLVKTSNQRVA